MLNYYNFILLLSSVILDTLKTSEKNKNRIRTRKKASPPAALLATPAIAPTIQQFSHSTAASESFRPSREQRSSFCKDADGWANAENEHHRDEHDDDDDDEEQDSNSSTTSSSDENNAAAPLKTSSAIARSRNHPAVTYSEEDGDTNNTGNFLKKKLKGSSTTTTKSNFRKK